MFKFLLMLPLVFAAPQGRVSWSDASRKELRIRVEGKDELLGKCLKGGLEMEYEFEVQLCRRRAAWFDACAERLRDRHRLSLEPISGSYHFVSDRFGDEIGPQTHIISAQEEAVMALSEMNPVTLEYLAQADPKLMYSQNSYLRVRVQSHCRGDYNRTWARISSFLTLGLVRISGFDTGWMDFKLGLGEER